MSYINDEKVTYFAETDFRGNKTRFGIKGKDRTKHMYILGKTGMGKSTMLENMAIQDIQNDEGLIFIDPHGSSAVKILEYIPKHRVDDVVYFSPNDIEYPFSFNVLEKVAPEKRSFVAQGLMNTFKKIWIDQFSSRMEYLLNYCLLALLETPDATILGINRLLGDKDYCNHVMEYVSDPMVLNFWKNEFEKYSKDYATEAVAPIQNKVGQFVTNPMIRNILGQTESKLDFRKLMDEKKIVIVNLSKGLIGPDNMRLIGGMLITKIYIATMSRANLSAHELDATAPCYLYVDEFQNFANQAFSEILSESRKYKLALTMSNQYFDQIDEEVRQAIVGNVGTLAVFRVGSTDAELMEKEMTPTFTAEHIVNLQFTQIYLRLMIDGVTSKPFSATTLPPIPAPKENYLSDIVFVSRQKYTLPKKEVEDAIRKWNLTNFHNAKQEEEAERKKEEKKQLEQNPLPIATPETAGVSPVSEGEGSSSSRSILENDVLQEKDAFNFADDFDDLEDGLYNENWGKEVISNEERKVLEDTKVEIPELKIDDYLNSETAEKLVEQREEISENIKAFMAARKNARLNATVNHIKSPIQRAKKEVPEDVLRTLLDN